VRWVATSRPFRSGQGVVDGLAMIIDGYKESARRCDVVVRLLFVASVSSYTLAISAIILAMFIPALALPFDAQ